MLKRSGIMLALLVLCWVLSLPFTPAYQSLEMVLFLAAISCAAILSVAIIFAKNVSTKGTLCLVLGVALLILAAASLFLVDLILAGEILFGGISVSVLTYLYVRGKVKPAPVQPEMEDHGLE